MKLRCCAGRSGHPVGIDQPPFALRAIDSRNRQVVQSVFQRLLEASRRRPLDLRENGSEVRHRNDAAARQPVRQPVRVSGGAAEQMLPILASGRACRSWVAPERGGNLRVAVRDLRRCLPFPFPEIQLPQFFGVGQPQPATGNGIGGRDRPGKIRRHDRCIAGDRCRQAFDPRSVGKIGVHIRPASQG